MSHEHGISKSRRHHDNNNDNSNNDNSNDNNNNSPTTIAVSSSPSQHNTTNQLERQQQQSEEKPVAKEPEISEFELFNDNIDLAQLIVMTRSQLALYNGKDKPEMYVAIKGYVYDVTSNAKSYGPGKAYHSLVARDCSRMLGMNILNVAKLYPEDGNSPTNEPNHRRSEIDTWSVSDLTERQQATVDKWELFFKKRYRIVAVIVDHGFKTV